MPNNNQRPKVGVLLWWDGKLKMTDQPVLPAKFEYTNILSLRPLRVFVSW
jgi:hypothetical protein